MKRIRYCFDTLRRRLCWTALRVAARLTIACLLLSFFGSSRLAAIGQANGTTTVSINPASQEISLGATGITDVLVENVTNLYGFEFQITFDPTLVEVVDANPVQAGVQIQPGDFLSPDWLLENIVDNDNGTIVYALCQLNPSPPQSGDGVLAIITWRGKAEGTSPIHFTDVQLGAPGGTPIPATSQDGEVTVGEPSPGPTITSLSPDWATAGGPGFTLTVHGANFVSGSTVHWDGVARTTTFVNSTQLLAAITAADIATAGTVDITVFNPAPGGGTSNTLLFTIANPPPIITSLSPISATVSGPAFTLTINGTNFVSGSTVHWDDVARTTTFVNGTQLLADITAADIATAGTVDITVFNPAPGGGTSNTLLFTIANPPPTITSLSPISATVSGPAFTLTINGTNFVSGSSMHWNGAARTVTFVSSTQLLADITAADIATAGTVDITVVNPAPGGGTSNTLPFEITESGPEPPSNLVYLPLVLRRWPPILDTPTLYPISNPDGDGSYTVSWSAVSQATSYVLQEAKNSDFADAVEIYSGASTSHAVSGRGAARYYYRVKARNSWGDSDWSNVEWVDVLWEGEPNDDARTQANGPIISGLTYYGTFPGSIDPKDYFYFDLSVAHTVELWLRNIQAGCNYDLTLRNASLKVVGHSGEPGNANEHILTGVLPAGRYYIQVTNASQTGSTQPYHLRVVYE